MLRGNPRALRCKRIDATQEGEANAMQRKDADVESLLMRERRAGLPLPRQIALYLDRFALSKDVWSGSPPVRESALSYNRTMRWMLVPYIRRLILIAASLFLAIAPAEALAAEAKFFIIPAAALAVGSSIAVTVTLLTLAGFLFLVTNAGLETKNKSSSQIAN